MENKKGASADSEAKREAEIREDANSEPSKPMNGVQNTALHVGVAMGVGFAVSAVQYGVMNNRGGITKKEYRQQVVKNTVAAGGSATGYAIGAAIGSFIPIPVVGTYAGGAVGGVIGGFLGSRGGEVLDKFFFSQ